MPGLWDDRRKTRMSYMADEASLLLAILVVIRLLQNVDQEPGITASSGARVRPLPLRLDLRDSLGLFSFLKRFTATPVEWHSRLPVGVLVRFRLLEEFGITL